MIVICKMKTRVSAPRFWFYILILNNVDYAMVVEGLLHDNVCLITLLSRERCSQYERFRLIMVNKTFIFEKEKPLIVNNAEARRVNCNTSWCIVVSRLPVTNYCSANTYSGHGS